MTQEELKSLAKEYLGKWVSFRINKLKSDKGLDTIKFIKPTNVRTYPQPDLRNEVFLVGQSIKIDLNYQLEGLRYSKNDYVVFNPSLKVVFPIEEQIAQFENIINIYNNLNIDNIMTQQEKILANSAKTCEDKQQVEIDEKYKIGKWFTGLIPCWVDAPSTLQAAHNHHGENIVAIRLKNGVYRCCCVDNKEPTTFYLSEDTHLVEGWHNRENN